MSKVVAVVEVEITQEKLVSFLGAINEFCIDEEDGDSPITLEEAITNERLLDYICKEAVEDGVAMYDPEEFIQNDGWCDVADYR